jgi:hypothetical protein
LKIYTLFKFSLATAPNLPEKLALNGRVLKSIASVALVRKAVDEIKESIFFKCSCLKKIKVLVVSKEKLTVISLT